MRKLLRIREEAENGNVKIDSGMMADWKESEIKKARNKARAGERMNGQDNGRRGVRRRKQNRWGNRLAIVGITIVVFCLGVVVNVKSTSLKKKELEYQIKEEALVKQVEQEENRAAELEEYRIYVQTKQYIEEVAKQKLGLVKPDEILLKPIPKN